MKYNYTIELCETALIAVQNGFINDKIKKIIDNNYLDEASKRDQQEDQVKDSFYNANKRLAYEVGFLKNYYERAKVYLKKLGLNGQPYKFLYSEKITTPAQFYVNVTKVYEDDSWTYEPFFGSGKSKTREEFIDEFNKLYEGTGVVLRGCDGPFIRPASVTYVYDKLYTIEERVKGE